MKKFEQYIKEVKEQLTYNTSDDYKDNHVTYLYSNEQIDDNLEYFKESMKFGLSPYKALLFFQDHLEENVEQIKLEISNQLYKSTNIVDLSDLGNEIGFTIGKYLRKNKLGFEPDDFISGIKHGISLIDSTHGEQ